MNFCWLKLEDIFTELEIVLKGSVSSFAMKYKKSEPARRTYSEVLYLSDTPIKKQDPLN